MAVRLLDRFDAAVGDGIERAMIHHHMRRLRRHGQLAAIAPASEGLRAQTAAPPRHGNSLEILIDGENALPRMAEAIRGAQRHVHVCSWNLEPGFDPGGRPRSSESSRPSCASRRPTTSPAIPRSAARRAGCRRFADDFVVDG